MSKFCRAGFRRPLDEFQQTIWLRLSAEGPEKRENRSLGNYPRNALGAARTATGTAPG
jgi:hypothetical protein